MTLPTHDTVLSQFHDLLADHSFDGRADAPTVLLNEVMKIERSQHLQAQLQAQAKRVQGAGDQLDKPTVADQIGKLVAQIHLDVAGVEQLEGVIVRLLEVDDESHEFTQG